MKTTKSTVIRWGLLGLGPIVIFLVYLTNGSWLGRDQPEEIQEFGLGLLLFFPLLMAMYVGAVAFFWRRHGLGRPIMDVEDEIKVGPEHLYRVLSATKVREKLYLVALSSCGGATEDVDKKCVTTIFIRKLPPGGIQEVMTIECGQREFALAPLPALEGDERRLQLSQSA